MKDDDKEYLKYSPIDRAVESTGKFFVVLIFTIVGFISGLIIRLFVLPTTIDSFSSLAWQYLPWGFVGALVLGVITFKYYRQVAFLVCFIPGCDAG